MLGSVGLPGLSGFVGEFLTIFGMFISGGTGGEVSFWAEFMPHPMLLGAVATSGVIFGAIYLLYMFQKMMFGPLNNPKNKELKDVSWREIAVFTPLVIGIFVMGLFPTPFLKTMDPTVDQFVTRFEAKLAEPDGPAHLMGQAAPTPTPAPAPAAPDPHAGHNHGAGESAH
jgi:NADH-quinone oxidoreductase subunit M